MMRILLRKMKHWPRKVLIGKSFAAIKTLNAVKTFPFTRRLKLAHHTINYIIRHFARTLIVASLTFFNRNNKHSCHKSSIRDLKNSAAIFISNVSRIIKNIKSFCDCFTGTPQHNREDFIWVSLNSRITIKFFADCVARKMNRV